MEEGDSGGDVAGVEVGSEEAVEEVGHRKCLWSPQQLLVMVVMANNKGDKIWQRSKK